MGIQPFSFRHGDDGLSNVLYALFADLLKGDFLYVDELV
jgi:hypothetical protein